MASKTFRDATNTGTEVYVGEGINADSVHLIIRRAGATIGKAGIYLNTSDIPALMLALGEVMGWPEEDPNSITHPIMRSLGDVIRIQERITAEEEAEARKQAELEALALELSNEYVTQLGFDPVESWDDSGERRKTAWVAVARIARELAGEGGK